MERKMLQESCTFTCDVLSDRVSLKYTPSEEHLKVWSNNLKELLYESLHSCYNRGAIKMFFFNEAVEASPNLLCKLAQCSAVVLRNSRTPKALQTQDICFSLLVNTSLDEH